MLSMATSITPISRSLPSGTVFYTWVNIRCKNLPRVGQDSVQINSNTLQPGTNVAPMLRWRRLVAQRLQIDRDIHIHLLAEVTLLQIDDLKCVWRFPRPSSPFLLEPQRLQARSELSFDW